MISSIWNKATGYWAMWTKIIRFPMKQNAIGFLFLLRCNLQTMTSIVLVAAEWLSALIDESYTDGFCARFPLAPAESNKNAKFKFHLSIHLIEFHAYEYLNLNLNLNLRQDRNVIRSFACFCFFFLSNLQLEWLIDGQIDRVKKRFEKRRVSLHSINATHTSR